MAAIEQTTQRGLACPDCGSLRLKVIYTRSRFGAKVVRRRECRECRAIRLCRAWAGGGTGVACSVGKVAVGQAPISFV